MKLILNNWGIEGVNYVVIDGKRVIPPEEMNRRLNDPNYRRETGVGLYVYPFPQRAMEFWTQRAIPTP